MARAHNDLSPEALAALKADGLEYMGRGFRELGEVHPGGDLLDQLRADAELAGLTEAEQIDAGILPASSQAADEEVPADPRRSELATERTELRPGWPLGSPHPGAHSWSRDPFEGGWWCVAGEVRHPAAPEVADQLDVEDGALADDIDDRVPLDGDDNTPAADCDCCDDGDLHPVGSGGCIAGGRPIEDVHLPEFDQFAEEVGLAALLDQLGEQGPQFAPWRTPLGPDGPLLITLPGVFDLTAEQYHDPSVTGDWLSNSDAKKLLKTCPAQFQYDRQNGVRKTSDAFDFGHVWHAVILGKGEAYEVFEPKKLDGRTKEGKAQKRDVEAARAAGRTPIYGDQFALIEAMAEAVEANQVAHDLLTQPGQSEVCLFWREHVRITDPKNKLYGQVVEVQRRAMIDRLPDMPADRSQTVTLVDGKTADEVKPDDDLRKKIYDYGYHRQADTYQMAVMALFGVDADVVLLFQSKKPPHLIVPVDLDTPAMRVAAAENHQAMQTWAECVATGEWPEYTRGIATSGVPAWIERQFEEEMDIG